MKLRRTLLLTLCCLALVACDSEVREVTTSSDVAYDEYQAGLRQLYRAEFPEARDHFEAAVAEDPDFAMGHMMLAKTLRSLGESVGAQEHIDKAVALIPQLPEEEQLQVRITEKALEFQIEEATQVAKELAEKYPDNPTAIAFLGERAWMDLDYEGAVRQFQRVLSEDPERVDIHNTLGAVYLSAGRYDDAITSFQRYIFYAPGLPNPIDSLGEAYLNCGRYEEAIQQFTDALQLDPTFLSAGKHLSTALAIIGRHRDARKILDEMLPVFEERNQLEEREQLLMDIEYEARNWEALLKLAESQDVTNTIDPAHPNYPLMVHFSSTVAHLELGNTAAAAESADDLLEYLELFRSRLPDSGFMKSQFQIVDAYLRSKFARAHGQPEEGIERLRTALANSTFGPHHLMEFRHELAKAYFQNGQYQQALEASSKGLEVIPNHPDLNLIATKSLVEMARKEDAVPFLRRYLEVMRYADEDHKDVQFAKQLAARLVPAG